jgi:hypothetical protein
MLTRIRINIFSKKTKKLLDLRGIVWYRLFKYYYLEVMEMDDTRKNVLKKRIAEEMMDDYSGALERNFELAKQLLRVTREGNVTVLFKEKLTGEEQIILYLIGKLYAKEASFVEKHEVDNKELMDELGIPKGSLLPWLKNLRDRKTVKQTKIGRNVFHTVPLNLVEKNLKNIENKLGTHPKED